MPRLSALEGSCACSQWCFWFCVPEQCFTGSWDAIQGQSGFLTKPNMPRRGCWPGLMLLAACLATAHAQVRLMGGAGVLGRGRLAPSSLGCVPKVSGVLTLGTPGQWCTLVS